MTNIQTNQIETLSDAELDNVAGGFSLGLLKFQAHLIVAATHHPIDNAGFIAHEAKNVVKNIFSIF
jgi:hypothetical protein